MLDQATRLREIAERYCERPAARKPHIITIASGKGGVGKSTVALNVAVRLAELGSSTLLFDADENLGNLDVMTGISPTHRLGNVLQGEIDVHAALVSPMENLFILPGNSGDAGVPRLTIEKQRELLKDLSDVEENFDYLVIDTAAGIGEDVVGLAVCSQETIVVTTPEPTAVMDAYAIIKMITLADSMVPMNVIVNSARSAEEAADTAAKLQLAVKNFLNQSVGYLGWIPNDPNVSRAVMRQRPVVTEFPTTGASLSLLDISEKVLMHTASSKKQRFHMV